MTAPIFISHSSKDQKVARTICNALESRGLKCWIASRDVGPGENFQEAIVKAIRSAKVMVLVFTENANNSAEIKKELALASRFNREVIPVRSEDVMPNDALAYEFATRQWIDLFADWDQEIGRLSNWIADIVARDATDARPDMPRGVREAPEGARIARFSRPPARRPVAIPITVAAVAAIAVLGTAAIMMMRSPPTASSNQIEIAYVTPSNAALQPIHDNMKKRQILESLQQLLAPLKLPRKLPLRLQQCNQANAFYNLNNDGAVTICYELVDWIERNAPNKPSAGLDRQDAIVGPLVEVMLHQISHAVLGMLQVPTFGRSEDNVDQMAAIIMVNFAGRDVTRRLITSSASFVRALISAPDAAPERYSDTHGTWPMRFFNHLCITYGSDLLAFSDFVHNGLLSTTRAADCAREYQQVREAFVKLILPHIDVDLMRRVQSREWLKPEDGS